MLDLVCDKCLQGENGTCSRHLVSQCPTLSGSGVCITVPVKLVSPTLTASGLAGSPFPYYWNPCSDFSGSYNHLYGCLHQGWGTHMGDSQILGTWSHMDSKLHINSLELRVVFLALRHWPLVLQDHHTSSSRVYS